MANPSESPETREREKVQELDRQKLREKVEPLLSALFPKGATFLGQALPGISLVNLEDPTSTKESLDALTPYQLQALARRLRTARKLARDQKSLSDAVQAAEKEHTRFQEALDKNLAAVYKQIRPIETQYRTLNQFFENAQRNPGEKLSAEVFNTDPKSLFEDSSESMQVLKKAIEETNAEAFYQSKAKANLVIPGHWAENKYLSRLEDFLADNRVMLFTDIFAGQKKMDTMDAFVERLELEQYKGLRQGSFGRAHMVVCVNEVCGRQKYAWEDEPVWLPASTAISGRVYYQDQSWEFNSPRHAPAGFQRGKVMTSQPMVRAKLNNSAVGGFNQTYSLVPVIESRGDVYAMGVGTLCTDENMKQYPTVRIHDFIMKAMCDFSRNLLFERFDERSKENVRAGLIRFFDALVKEGVIEKYTGLAVERDGKPGEKGKAKVNVQIKFYDVVTQVRVGANFDEDGNPKAI